MQQNSDVVGWASVWPTINSDLVGWASALRNRVHVGEDILTAAADGGLMDLICLFCP